MDALGPSKPSVRSKPKIPKLNNANKSLDSKPKPVADSQVNDKASPSSQANSNQINNLDNLKNKVIGI